MITFDVKTTTATIPIDQTEYSLYDDNKDIIWPTLVGIFVALALGWMICRYKCSSNERSPHIVQCCPKSLCERIRLCCLFLCRYKTESPQQQQPYSTFDWRTPTIKDRSSNTNVFEIPLVSDRPSTSQWPPTLLPSENQEASIPFSITIESTANSFEPKRHPLRRDSLLPESERRDSSLWPFPTANMIFHKQTSEMKRNHLFFNT